MEGVNFNLEQEKPIIAITIGEAAGIGPEIILKALIDGIIFDYCRPLIIGDYGVVEKCKNSLGINLNFNIIKEVEEAVWDVEQVNFINLNNIPLEKFVIGKPNALTGKAMIDYTKLAVKLAVEKKVHGAVGCPHSKKAAEEAGYHFDGYPNMIATMTGSENPFLMLCSEKIRIANVTLHVSLKEAINMIKKELILNCINEVDIAVKGLGIHQPKIAVAGLNPHAGEDRMFGDEDADEIKPAVTAARELGIDAVGPIASDLLFSGFEDGNYDAYIAMYHDQAHIPSKMLATKTVAVAIGVPVNWATVNHGCALDIAWQGVADPEKIIEVIKVVSQRSNMDMQLNKAN